MYSTKYFSGSLRVPYEAVILVEPPLIDRRVFHDNIEDRQRQTSMLTKAISAQRNQWDSRAAAYEWFAKRFPWKAWDDRVLRIFVVRHLHRSLSYPQSTMVTLVNLEQRPTSRG